MTNPLLTALVGDIGGTNARFAVADLSGPQAPHIGSVTQLASANFASLSAAVADYLSRLERSPACAVLAVAGPVSDGEAVLTNLGWRAYETELLRAGFSQVRLINDFQALAAAADLLADDDLIFAGPRLSRFPAGNVVVLGAGTGFGAAALIRDAGRATTVASEGGHIGFSPEDAAEREILRLLTERFGRVSLERLVSGPGLINLYEALCVIEGVPPQHNSAPAILSAAQHDPLSRSAVVRCCAIFGAAAGDIALTFGARGGVLLAGGLSEALMPFLPDSQFRARFEGKGRLAHLVQKIPTQLIIRPDAALLGCARLAKADLQP